MCQLSDSEYSATHNHGKVYYAICRRSSYPSPPYLPFLDLYSSHRQPSAKPTSEPTVAPTNSPTNAPTMAPTNSPTKSPTPFPTDSPTTMPSSQPTSDIGDDSGGGTFKEYTTPNIREATDKAHGLVFTITAKSRDVIITAIGILGVGDGNGAKKSDISVFSHAGLYEDYSDEQQVKEKGKKKGKKEGKKDGKKNGKKKGKKRRNLSNVAAWNEYFEDKVVLYPQEIVDVKLDEELTIPAGDTVSVYVASKKGFSYKESACNEFDAYAESDDFVLNVGTTIKKEFKQMLADFAGRIVYQTGVSA